MKNKTTNRKFLNIESKSKKIQIEKEIHEFEDKKSEKIMELGIAVYDKIRRGLIDESLFGELICEIKQIDLEVYNRMLDVAILEGHDEHAPICECGYILKNNEKFCPNCGTKIKKDADFILCEVCASKIDDDSKFCVCCGSKVVKKQKFDLDEYEYDDSEDNKAEIYEDNDEQSYQEDILLNTYIVENDEKDDFKFDENKEKIQLNKKEELNNESISDKI